MNYNCMNSNHSLNSFEFYYHIGPTVHGVAHNFNCIESLITSLELIYIRHISVVYLDCCNSGSRSKCMSSSWITISWGRSVSHPIYTMYIWVNNLQSNATFMNWREQILLFQFLYRLFSPHASLSTPFAYDTQTQNKYHCLS